MINHVIDDLWKSDARTAFANFVGSQAFTLTGASRFPSDLPVRASSARVYTFMFNRFLKWLGSRHAGGIPTVEVDAATIAAFLDEVGKDATSEIRWRYLRLLERVYDHLVANGLRVTNPVSESVIDRIDIRGRKEVTGQDNPMAWVPDQAQAKLSNHLGALTIKDGWKNRRDAALAAVLVGAGLKLSEALALHCSDVQRHGNLTIIDVSKGLGTGNARRVRVLDFAAPILNAWLLQRGSSNTSAGPLVLFNGTGDSPAPMDAATAYRRIRKIMEDAGLSPRHLGGRTLRNSYAVTMLTGGMAPDKVGALLGLQEDKSINRYLKAPGVNASAAKASSFSR